MDRKPVEKDWVKVIIKKLFQISIKLQLHANQINKYYNIDI